jgi:hypothetical protein
VAHRAPEVDVGVLRAGGKGPTAHHISLQSRAWWVFGLQNRKLNHSVHGGLRYVPRLLDVFGDRGRPKESRRVSLTQRRGKGTVNERLPEGFWWALRWFQFVR